MIIQLIAKKKSHATHHYVQFGHRGVNLHHVRLLVGEGQKIFHQRAYTTEVKPHYVKVNIFAKSTILMQKSYAFAGIVSSRRSREEDCNTLTCSAEPSFGKLAVFYDIKKMAKKFYFSPFLIVVSVKMSNPIFKIF